MFKQTFFALMVVIAMRALEIAGRLMGIDDDDDDRPDTGYHGGDYPPPPPRDRPWWDEEEGARWLLRVVPHPDLTRERR